MDPQTPSAATERARLAVVLTTVAISVGGVVLFSLVPWSDWRTGLLLNLVENAILVAFSIRYRDRLIPHLMLFGFAVGLAELPADAWLVERDRDARLLHRRRSDDLALARLDAAGVGDGRRPVRLPRHAAPRVAEGMGAAAGGRDRGGQHPVLRGDGAADALVAVRELPDAPAHARTTSSSASS